MMEIEKGCYSDMFEKIKSGKKKFEIRLGNLNVNNGDTLILKEKNKDGQETGRKIKKKVGFVIKTKDLDYWSNKDIDKFGFVIIQLEDIK